MDSSPVNNLMVNLWALQVQPQCLKESLSSDLDLESKKQQMSECQHRYRSDLGKSFQKLNQIYGDN